MVAQVFLVTRTQVKTNDRNKVREVIINADSAQTDAQIIASAVAGLNTVQPVESGAEAAYPAGYLDTVTQIAASPTGPLNTDGDFLSYPDRVSEFDF